MKHQDFRDAAIAEAFDAIEGSILPSLTLLIERAAGADAADCASRAEELRVLARQLEDLTALAAIAAPPRQPRANPFSTDA